MSVKYSAPAGRAILIVFCAIGAAAITIAPISLLASCARKTSLKNADKTADVPLASRQTPKAKKLGTQALASPSALSQSGRNLPVPLAASMHAFGLRVPSVPRVARDFSIGPLQSYRPAEGDEAAVFAVAHSFAEGIASRKLDKGILLPEARDALNVLLAPAATGSGSETVVPYRLGAIHLKGSDASLRLRLPGEAGAAREEGLLSLRKIGATWYVEAFALDMPTSGALAFNPDSSAGPQ
jgi:hypothetical protein